MSLLLSPGFIIITIIFCILILPVDATVYYVATNGDNSNPGTQDLPWATPGYGSKQLNPGDTLIISSGQYILSEFLSDMITPVSGEPGNWITIRGEAGSWPILAGNNNLLSAVDINGSYTRIENLEITSYERADFRNGILVENSPSNNLIFSNITIHHIDESGFILKDVDGVKIQNCNVSYIGGDAIGGPRGDYGGVRNLFVENCILAYTGHYYQGGPGPGPYDRPDGFGIELSAGPIEISNTTSMHNLGDGLDSKSNDTFIHHCIVANNYGDGVKLWGNNSTAENTLIYGTGDGKNDSGWCGLVITGEQDSRYTLRNLDIHDNPTRQAYSMTVQYADLTPIILNMTNCIISNGYGAAFFESSVCLTAQNNIFYRGLDNPVQVYASGKSYTTEDIEAGQLGPGNICCDPEYIEPAWGKIGNYHLKSDSPAIDAGSVFNSPDTDLDWKRRPAGKGFDIGAYEYVSSDPNPPDSVSNLKNATYLPFSVNWTWTDPTDYDFERVIVYLDGVFKANVTRGVQFYNATSLAPGTGYTIRTKTVDATGNTNLTWVNHTAYTVSSPVITSISPVMGYPLQNWPVTITGTYFRPNASVTISNSTISKSGEVISLSDTQIACILPVDQLASGVYNVSVQNEDSTTAKISHEIAPLLIILSN